MAQHRQSENTAARKRRRVGGRADTVRMVSLKKIVSTFEYRMVLRNPQTGAAFDLPAAVDTRAHFTTVPQRVWDELGLQVVRTAEMGLANGEIVPTPIGYAEIEVDGETVLVLCAQGEADSPPLLGATTMEALLLMPDPVNERFLRGRGLRGCEALAARPEPVEGPARCAPTLMIRRAPHDRIASQALRV